jgi:hypothetical protein
MKPEEIIKYIFDEERQDYQSRLMKCRKAGLVQARQRSMYLIKFFYPQTTWDEVGICLGQKHDGAIHAYNKVTNYIATEKKYEREMSKYITVIRGRMNNRLQVNCVTATYKMNNKRISLTKIEGDNWLVFVKKLEGKKIDKKHLVFTDEAINGLLEMYQILK